MSLNLLRKLALLVFSVSMMGTVIADAGSIPTNSVPLHTYAMKKIYCYSSPGGARNGSIYAGDYVIVTKLRSDGWAYGSYPTKTKRVYKWFKASDLVSDRNANYTRYAPTAKTYVYRENTHKASMGWVNNNEVITVVGGIGNSRQIIYKVDGNGGYKMGWIPSRDCWSASQLPGRVARNSAVVGQNIKLNVPYYMQTNTRWGEEKIGDKKIKDIGCTLTCLSMKYSYQSGKTMYPDEMKGNFKFSNNSIIWSSLDNFNYKYPAYNTKINNNIMSKIYDELKNDKPVIVGGKKSNGNQHYVVVNGYNGNSTTNFNAVNFQILDPMNKSRTTLDSFLKVFPTVYRIIY